MTECKNLEGFVSKLLKEEESLRKQTETYVSNLLVRGQRQKCASCGS